MALIKCEKQQFLTHLHANPILSKTVHLHRHTQTQTHITTFHAFDEILQLAKKKQVETKTHATITCKTEAICQEVSQYGN